MDHQEEEETSLVVLLETEEASEAPGTGLDQIWRPGLDLAEGEAEVGEALSEEVVVEDLVKASERKHLEDFMGEEEEEEEDPGLVEEGAGPEAFPAGSEDHMTEDFLSITRRVWAVTGRRRAHKSQFLMTWRELSLDPAVRGSGRSGMTLKPPSLLTSPRQAPRRGSSPSPGTRSKYRRPSICYSSQSGRTRGLAEEADTREDLRLNFGMWTLSPPLYRL